MPDGQYKLTWFSLFRQTDMAPSSSKAPTRRGSTRRTRTTVHANGSAEITFRVERTFNRLIV